MTAKCLSTPTPAIVSPDSSYYKCRLIIKYAPSAIDRDVSTRNYSKRPIEIEGEISTIFSVLDHESSNQMHAEYLDENKNSAEAVELLSGKQRHEEESKPNNFNIGSPILFNYQAPARHCQTFPQRRGEAPENLA